ncbi:hypothetical protein EMCRGX_G013792 [Ephydatia muelleri]
MKTKKSIDSNEWLGTMAIASIALAVAVIHGTHLYVLFENDRFFSHLSPLERELSFRTEAGFYYSYYKTVVTAPSFRLGLQKLVSDNVTEFPSTINTLQRFNLYPEVFLGFLYRTFTIVFGPLSVECFTVSRGLGQPSVRTCTGPGEPIYFYVLSVFALNGLYCAGLFLLSTLLSESVVGGLLSIILFFYNHGEATRVMWTPPLRESFAVPFLAFQLAAVVHTFRHPRPSWSEFASILLSSLFFLVPWQLSQFVILTQTLAQMAVYSVRLMPGRKAATVICAQLSSSSVSSFSVSSSSSSISSSSVSSSSVSSSSVSSSSVSSSSVISSHYNSISSTTVNYPYNIAALSNTAILCIHVL